MDLFDPVESKKNGRVLHYFWLYWKTIPWKDYCAWNVKVNVGQILVHDCLLFVTVKRRYASTTHTFECEMWDDGVTRILPKN